MVSLGQVPARSTPRLAPMMATHTPTQPQPPPPVGSPTIDLTGGGSMATLLQVPNFAQQGPGGQTQTQTAQVAPHAPANNAQTNNAPTNNAPPTPLTSHTSDQLLQHRLSATETALHSLKQHFAQAHASQVNVAQSLTLQGRQMAQLLERLNAPPPPPPAVAPAPPPPALRPAPLAPVPMVDPRQLLPPGGPMPPQFPIPHAELGGDLHAQFRHSPSMNAALQQQVMATHARQQQPQTVPTMPLGGMPQMGSHMPGNFHNPYSSPGLGMGSYPTHGHGMVTNHGMGIPSGAVHKALAALQSGTQRTEPYKIVDFMPLDRFSSLDDTNRAQLVLRDGVLSSEPKKKTKEPRNFTQWSLANNGIIQVLVHEGHSMVDLLQYTSRIADHANRFAWSFVYWYDSLFRERQFYLNLSWAHEQTDLLTECFCRVNSGLATPPQVPKMPTLKTAQQPASQTKPQLTPGTFNGKTVCITWNLTGKCKHGANCKFLHACNECGDASHTFRHHE